MDIDTVKRSAVAAAIVLLLAGASGASAQALSAGPAGAAAVASSASGVEALPLPSSGDLRTKKSATPATSADDGEPASAPDRSLSDFVANDTSLDTLLDALAGQMRRPVIASAKVRHKRVTGEFDLKHSRALLNALGQRMPLLWYDDGSSIYVYDNSEIKNAVVSMRHATVRNLLTFIHETHLYDSRFPVRGDEFGGTFYVTGAPIYVNLVTAAAKYLDELQTTTVLDKQVVKVVRLEHSFVGDRRYMLRDQEVDVPGMATVLAQIYSVKARRVAPSAPVTTPRSTPVSDAPRGDTGGHLPFSLSAPLPGAQPLQGGQSVGAQTDARTNAKDGSVSTASMDIESADGVRAVAYPDTNSLVLAGPLDKVRDMEALIGSLDVAKRQIELSLWIIDIKKSRLDQLGVSWQGAVGFGSLSVGLNNSGGLTTTLDGAKFLASVMALSQSGDATVVSRPIVLTQENVPAIFDSNQTFYAKLIGERSVQLDHVTYGTLVSVLPRLSSDGAQVEMAVDVEDGNADNTTTGTDTNRDNTSNTGTLPLVDRTVINTVARVPREKSLLIGGTTRDDVNRHDYRVPGLAAIPLVGGLFRGHTEKHEQVVRVFLIQPKLLSSDAVWRSGQSWEPGGANDNPSLRATVNLLQPYVGKR